MVTYIVINYKGNRHAKTEQKLSAAFALLELDEKRSKIASGETVIREICTPYELLEAQLKANLLTREK